MTRLVVMLLLIMYFFTSGNMQTLGSDYISQYRTGAITLKIPIRVTNTGSNPDPMYAECFMCTRKLNLITPIF